MGLDMFLMKSVEKPTTVKYLEVSDMLSVTDKYNVTNLISKDRMVYITYKGERLFARGIEKACSEDSIIVYCTYRNKDTDHLESGKLEMLITDIEKVEFEVMYWRKANQIHKWFVDNVQDHEDDCKEYLVTYKNIQDLLVCCNEVLSNHDTCKTILPTQVGFFFGSTDYGEWYFEDLRETVVGLADIKETDVLHYHSSW